MHAHLRSVHEMVESMAFGEMMIPTPATPTDSSAGSLDTSDGGWFLDDFYAKIRNVGEAIVSAKKPPIALVDIFPPFDVSKAENSLSVDAENGTEPATMAIQIADEHSYAFTRKPANNPLIVQSDIDDDADATSESSADAPIFYDNNKNWVWADDSDDN